MAESKRICGFEIAQFTRMINVALGAVMVVFSALTLFNIPSSLMSESPVLIISFKVYEM